MTQPFGALALQLVLTVVVTGFTKGTSKWRAMALIPMIFAIFYYVNTAVSIVNNFQANFGGAQAILAFYQYLDVALINKWDFRHGGPLPSHLPEKSVQISDENGGTIWQRLNFGVLATASFRKCGTPFETRGVRQFSQDEPAYVPTTTRFLIRAFVNFVAGYLLLDALTSFGDAQQTSELFAYDKIPIFKRLGDISLSDVMERILCTVIFWLVLFLVLNTFMALASIITVVFGMADISWWKPAFNFHHGFPYTVRRFWSHFWHLIVKDRIHEPAAFLAEKVFKWQRGSLTRRYGIMFLTFTFSMIFHGVADIAAGIPWSKTGTPSFFLVQVPAIMLEDFVQHICAPQAGSQLASPTLLSWRKMAGRLWVFVFLVWTTPSLAYPMNLQNGDGLIVPFSLLRWAQGRSA